MTRTEVEAFIEAMDDVQRAEAFGYTLFFVGDDHRLPFVTLIDTDQDADSVSDLDRDGVFRINIGVSKATFAVVEQAGEVRHEASRLDSIIPIRLRRANLAGG